jgi:hypothetical protein
MGRPRSPRDTAGAVEDSDHVLELVARLEGSPGALDGGQSEELRHR